METLPITVPIGHGPNHTLCKFNGGYIGIASSITDLQNAEREEVTVYELAQYEDLANRTYIIHIAHWFFNEPWKTYKLIKLMSEQELREMYPLIADQATKSILSIENGLSISAKIRGKVKSITGEEV